MKILYAIQGTGNGHISRARQFIPILSKYGELDLLVSGTSAEVNLDHSVRYFKPGISYTFGKNGGIDILETLNNLNPSAFIDDVMHLDPTSYDLVLNDFEPVSAWACKRSGIPCIGLSHQASFLSHKTPRPSNANPAAEWIFRYYAPCSSPIGFHYKPYDDFIYTPIIRNEIRAIEHNPQNIITVYLPAYDHTLLSKHLIGFKDYTWHVFSKHIKETTTFENIVVSPISNETYIRSLSQSSGLIAGAGFEAPAEALFMGLKLMVIPMNGQYEQQCNAEALKQMGVSVNHTIDQQFHVRINEWLNTSEPIRIDYPDQSDEIIKTIIEKQLQLI